MNSVKPFQLKILFFRLERFYTTYEPLLFKIDPVTLYLERFDQSLDRSWNPYLIQV